MYSEERQLKFRTVQKEFHAQPHNPIMHDWYKMYGDNPTAQEKNEHVLKKNLKNVWVRDMIELPTLNLKKHSMYTLDWHAAHDSNSKCKQGLHFKTSPVRHDLHRWDG